MKLTKIKILITCALLLSTTVMAQNVDTAVFEELLNQQLNTQKVIISAPGLPSKTHDLSMVAEDPYAPENVMKKYHPAEKIGWSQMIEYGRAFEQAGLMKLVKGTFEDKNFFDEKFSFTGYLMTFTDKARPYLVIMTDDARIGLKAGVMGVDKIIGVTYAKDDAATSASVSFTTKIDKKPQWLSAEILKQSGIEDFIGGKESVKFEREGDVWRIKDPVFLLSVKTPVFDFGK